MIIRKVLFFTTEGCPTGTGLNIFAFNNLCVPNGYKKSEFNKCNYLSGNEKIGYKCDLFRIRLHEDENDYPIRCKICIVACRDTTPSQEEKKKTEESKI